MLYCKYCDYYSEINVRRGSGELKFYCEFADYMFPSDVEELEIENPCGGLTYQDYLDSKNPSVRITASA